MHKQHLPKKRKRRAQTEKIRYWKCSMTPREKKVITNTHSAMAKPCRNIGTSLFLYWHPPPPKFPFHYERKFSFSYCNMEQKKAIKQKYSLNIKRNILVGKDHNFPAPLQPMADVLHLRSDKWSKLKALWIRIWNQPLSTRRHGLWK